MQPNTDPSAQPAAGGRFAAGPEPADEPFQNAGEAFKEAGRRLSELRDYASYFVVAKVDGVKSLLRKVGLYAALGVLGLLAGGTMVVTAVVLLCSGLARAIGAIFDIPWLGDLIVGTLLLGLIFGGAWFGISRLTKSWRQRTVDSYERKRQDQQRQHGHNVSERAANRG